MAFGLDELLELEHAGWRSLCDNTGGSFYGELMTPDAVMVLAGGTVMTRDDVVASLEHAPPWASYEITDASIHRVGDATLLTYTGIARRDDGSAFSAVMASAYVDDGSRPRLGHYQQTPLG